MTQGLSCDTHLNPGLFFHVAGVVCGLGAAVDSLPLGGRSVVVDRAGRGSLPVLHLGEGGRTGRRGARCGNRHQKTSVATVPGEEEQRGRAHGGE